MQQLIICYRLVRSYFSLNLVISEQYYGGSDPNKEAGEIVDQSSRCSNPHKVDVHSASPEEVELPEWHYNPRSYAAAMRIYLIYWLWSKYNGWDLKSDLQLDTISSYAFNRDEVLNIYLVVAYTLGIVLTVILYYVWYS